MRPGAGRKKAESRKKNDPHSQVPRFGGRNVLTLLLLVYNIMCIIFTHLHIVLYETERFRFCATAPLINNYAFCYFSAVTK